MPTVTTRDMRCSGCGKRSRHTFSLPRVMHPAIRTCPFCGNTWRLRLREPAHIECSSGCRLADNLQTPFTT